MMASARRVGIIRLAIELALVVAIVLLAVNRHRDGMAPQGAVFSVPTQEKVVALTYDDGPNPVFTPEILGVLDKYHVKATFFMVGERMEKYPEIVRDVLARGHVIGNHTYTHPRNIEADTQAQIIRELDRCEEVIERMTGMRAKLFRPPKGLINGAVLRIAGEEGYCTILWTVSADHHDAPMPQDMARRVLKHVRPGAIILAHDGILPMRWKDVAATPLIIEELRKRGYTFVTVPELLGRRCLRAGRTGAR